MKKVIGISVIFSFILFAGSIFADSPQNADNLKVLKKADGVQITSAALVNNRNFLAGREDGSIILVAGDRTTEYNSKSTVGPIDSIAVTAGGNGLGDFTYATADGRIYTYSKKDDQNSPLELPADVKAKILRYDVNGGLYCKTDSGSFYHYKGNYNWEKVSKVNSNFHSKLNQSGKLTYSVNAVQNNLQSTSKQNSGSQNDDRIYNGSCVFTWTSDGEVKASYDLNTEYDHRILAAQPVYVSNVYDSPNDAIYRVTIKGLGLDQVSLFEEGYNGISFTVTDENGDYKKTVYPVLGYIYNEDLEGTGVTGKTSCAYPREISFLWRGPKCTSEGEHKITVTEYFQNMNTTEDSSGHLIFPAPTKIHPQDPESDPYRDLPKAPAPWKPDSSEYSIGIFYIVSGATNMYYYPNGVSATPFLVQIKGPENPEDPNSSIIPLPPTREEYKHLSFYADNSDSSITKDRVISCNPYDADSDDFAILPAEDVEVNGFVKYGDNKTFNETGKVFYLIAGHNTSNDPISVCLGDYVAESNAVKNANTISGYGASVTIQMEAIQGSLKIITDQFNNVPAALNSSDPRSFTLEDSNKQTFKVSDWERDFSDDGAGYPDYIAPDTTSGDNAPEGVYLVFPQGLNSRTLFQGSSNPGRLNPAEMQVGYYFKPGDITGSADFLHADQYEINDKTSYCASLMNKELYAYLFDQYGRYATYTVKDDQSDNPKNVAHTYWERPICDNYTHIVLTNWSNVPICLHGYVNYKYGAKEANSLGGITKYDKGIFLPPDPYHKSGGVVFTTGFHSLVTDSHDRTFHVFGDCLCDQNADPDHYNYFTTDFQYRDNNNMVMSFNTFLYIPEHIQGLADEGDYSDLYLPVNQIYIYNRGGEHVSLDFWGVHFVEWNRSCDCGEKISDRNFFNEKKNSKNREWLYSQAGSYTVEHGEPYFGISGIDHTFTHSDLIPDDSIDGKSNGVLQIAEPDGGYTKATCDDLSS